MAREFKGWHMAAITVSAFAVIIAVNVFMAWQAIATFPGLEVTSSYLASQDFNAEARAQRALGWRLAPSYEPAGGALRLAFTDAQGQPVTVADLQVLVGRPTEAKDDRRPVFAQGPDGAYLAKEALAPGKWMLQVRARAGDGTLFQQRLDLWVKG